MPRGDGTGPDGKGPKKQNKGWPDRYGNGRGKCRRGQALDKNKDDGEKNEQN